MEGDYYCRMIGRGKYAEGSREGRRGLPPLAGLQIYGTTGPFGV
jgi:hypothetical protein